MKPILLLFLAISLSAHAQAVRPATVPVPRPPAYTPGYAPGTPPEPTYTPNGAGVPGERVPGTVTPPVPRSKGRILPREPDGAPGLWAADRAPVANSIGRDEVFDVELPYPDGADATTKGIVDTCTVTLSMATREARQDAYITGLPPDVRTCLAHKALALCTVITSDLFRNAQSTAGYPPNMRQALAKARGDAVEKAKRYCDGVRLEPAHNNAYDEVARKWDKTARELMPTDEKH